MKLASVLMAGVMTVGVGLAFAPTQASAAVCPAIGADSTCGVIITYNANGSVATMLTGQGPYDGSDDALVGIVNNTNHTIGSVTLTQTGGGQNIWGFDGDGIGNATYHAGTNALDTSSGKYGGPDAFFSNISGNTGTVNFVTPLAANGGTGFFSLEGPPSLSFSPTVPEPMSLGLLGVGLAGLGLMRRRKA